MGTRVKIERIPDESFITRDPFPKSKKIYVKGKIHDIEVPMREIELDDSNSSSAVDTGSAKNSSITVYDTSGPYTDQNIDMNVHRGLDPLRMKWIKDRGDVIELEDFSSEFARRSEADSKIKGIRFKHIRKPLIAKPGSNVSQMHYARKGVITPEMEFIAIRENQRIDELREQLGDLAAYHKGENFGANIPETAIKRACRGECNHPQQFKSP